VELLRRTVRKRCCKPPVSKPTAKPACPRRACSATNPGLDDGGADHDAEPIGPRTSLGDLGERRVCSSTFAGPLRFDGGHTHGRGAAHELASGANARRGNRELGMYKCVVVVQLQTV
jgi:hypothetical protein